MVIHSGDFDYKDDPDGWVHSYLPTNHSPSPSGQSNHGSTRSKLSLLFIDWKSRCWQVERLPRKNSQQIEQSWGGYLHWWNRIQRCLFLQRVKYMQFFLFNFNEISPSKNEWEPTLKSSRIFLFLFDWSKKVKEKFSVFCLISTKFLPQNYRETTLKSRINFVLCWFTPITTVRW
jgi:hypothetical protein